MRFVAMMAVALLATTAPSLAQSGMPQQGLPGMPQGMPQGMSPGMTSIPDAQQLRSMMEQPMKASFDRMSTKLLAQSQYSSFEERRLAVDGLKMFLYNQGYTTFGCVRKAPPGGDQKRAMQGCLQRQMGELNRMVGLMTKANYLLGGGRHVQCMSQSRLGGTAQAEFPPYPFLIGSMTQLVDMRKFTQCLQAG